MGINKSAAFPSRWLAKEDVQVPVIGTVGSVAMETLGSDSRPVVHWREPYLKPMALNVGNWNVLEDAYGEDSDLWAGKKVEIYADPYVQFQGKTVGGLKLRLPAPSPDPFGGDLLSWPDAIALVATVGLSKDQLTDALKARGLTAYNSARDTAAIREIVAAQSGEMPTGSDIAF